MRHFEVFHRTAAQLWNGSCQVFFLHDTVADYYNFVQCFGVFLESNIKGGLIPYAYFLWSKSDVGDNEGSVCGHILKHEFTIHVRNVPVCRSFYDNVGTGYRAECVLYDSCDGLSVLLQTCRNCRVRFSPQARCRVRDVILICQNTDAGQKRKQANYCHFVIFHVYMVI